MVKLPKVGSIFRNARQGTPLEGRRQNLADDSEFEIFHICRMPDCKFPSSKSRNSDYQGSDGKSHPTTHVSNFAFSEKASLVSPVFDAPGPMGIISVIGRPKRLVLGVVIVILELMIRLKQTLATIHVRQVVNDSAVYVFSVLLGGGLEFILSLWRVVLLVV